MIIDSTYFVVGNFIPNLSEPDPNSQRTVDIGHYINRAEEEVLSFALGRTMWEDLRKYTDNPLLEMPQNYKDLLDGVHYTIEGVDCYWMGLRDDITKESLLADYTYYIYFMDHLSLTTESGEVAMDSKVGGRTSMHSKLTKAYNTFLYRLHGSIRSGASGLTIEGDPYWLIGSKGVDYYGVYGRGGDVSMMQYLLDNREDYPLLDLRIGRFGGLDIKNEFGL